MAWTIVGGPDEGSWEGKDVAAWRCEIDDGSSSRMLLVEVTGTAMEVDPESLPEEVRAARETQGRSAVENVLDRDDPPGRITFATDGWGEQPYRGVK
jgi:hypothetical protein